MPNIWPELRQKGPIMALAPMADVTDAAFRRIINKYGRPDLFFTEFVSADGLSHETARPKLLRELYFTPPGAGLTPPEKPIIAQLFSSRPENIEKAARLCAELGFDGVDLNMGCPDRNVEKQGSGAALIKNPSLAKELIAAAKQGVASLREPTKSFTGSDPSPLPVSVKTRVGYNKLELESWTATLLEAKPAAITFHLRTRKEMSKVPANWELIKIPRDLAKGTETLILGNGDVANLAEAYAKADQYEIDGVMLGRAIFGNPWLFAGRELASDFSWSGRRRRRSEDLKNHSVATGLSVEEKLRVAIEHTKLFEELFGATETNKKLFGGHTKNFAVMKKHLKAYAQGFPGAAELREKLMATEDARAVERLVLDFLSANNF